MGTLLYYIYLFVVKESNRVIYVGSTRTIGSRINEHRRSMREKEREQPIHKYMKENNLKLIEDVSISIVDTADSKVEALKLETQYFDKYKKTISNIWKAEDKSGEYSPVRQPLICTKTNEIYKSQREAAEKLGISRYQVKKKTDLGELKPINIKDNYINLSTGETFVSAYHVKMRYNIDSKRVNELSRNGQLILNGMIIRKV